MPLYGLSIHRQIAEAATAAGLAPTPAQIDLINTIAETHAERTDDNRAIIDGLPPEKFIARELGRMRIAAVVATQAAVPEVDPDEGAGILRIGSGTQAGRHDAFARAIRAGQRADREAVAREIATWPNPWSARHSNRTRQAIISNTNPALAAKFKAEAVAQ